MNKEPFPQCFSEDCGENLVYKIFKLPSSMCARSNISQGLQGLSTKNQLSFRSSDILNSATWYQEKDLLGDLMAELRFKCIISKLNYLNCWSWELIFWSRLTREL